MPQSRNGLEVKKHEFLGALELNGCCIAPFAAEFFGIGAIRTSIQGHARKHVVARIEGLRHESQFEDQE